ncbi:hypothetical protein [Agromyces marinus]|uniref:DUF2238 domain-containing protein n=1 Tax=Agromyces marinus TaxID=1389020 RepID=A0ABM8GZM1_9MICO|nr:hypothetical protein [Agromyces marinus]UIP57875.1 hypothetical protein DSM26151_07410 [Agromyces marinus]BDZ53931.1 hypothetical protein GCM10025870_10040 [Agromyces marinus]
MSTVWTGLRRRAASPAAIAADLVRLVAVVCIPIAGFGWEPIDALSLTVVTASMLVPRLMNVRAGLDLAYCVVALVAAWSAVLDLYKTVDWWDIPMHFLLNGLVAAVCVLILVRTRVIADPADAPRPVLAAVMVTAGAGLSLAVGWEVFEWAAKTWIDPTMHVGYTDTIGDFVFGFLGSVTAGLAYPAFAMRPHDAEVTRSRSA